MHELRCQYEETLNVVVLDRVKMRLSIEFLNLKGKCPDSNLCSSVIMADSLLVHLRTYVILYIYIDNIGKSLNGSGLHIV